MHAALSPSFHTPTLPHSPCPFVGAAPGEILGVRISQLHTHERNMSADNITNLMQYVEVLVDVAMFGKDTANTLEGTRCTGQSSAAC